MEDNWRAFRREDALCEAGFNRIILVLMWRIKLGNEGKSRESDQEINEINQTEMMVK